VKTAMKREPIEKHIAIAEIESGHCNGCRRE
jgi:Ni,Fe-hydrogenase III small subunit